MLSDIDFPPTIQEQKFKKKTIYYFKMNHLIFSRSIIYFLFHCKYLLSIYTKLCTTTIMCNANIEKKSIKSKLIFFYSSRQGSIVHFDVFLLFFFINYNFSRNQNRANILDNKKRLKYMLYTVDFCFFFSFFFSRFIYYCDL